MPEGDTLYRTATRLRRTLCGQRVEEATSPRGLLRDSELAEISGATVVAVAARGKHLLIEFDGQRTLHSHLGMHGSWQVYLKQKPWRKPIRWAGLALTLSNCRVVCFQPKTLEWLNAVQLKRHPYLHRLGPDLLDESCDVDEILARFRRQPQRPLGEAVMDQTILCGIGNVFKSELLFLERVDPFRSVGELSDEALRGLIAHGQKLLRKNSAGEPRRTRLGDPRQALWVYGRSGEHCLVCGEKISLRRQGDLGRSTYWCGSCQR